MFSNVADQIRIGELIAAGHLVPPRTFVIDVGVQEQLSKVRRTADDFDMAEVDAIMNRSPVTDAVIRHWREKAGDRQTVVFCSTVDHASNVAGRLQRRRRRRRRSSPARCRRSERRVGAGAPMPPAAARWSSTSRC